MEYPFSFPKDAKLCMLLVGSKILNDGMQHLGPARVFKLCQDSLKPSCFERNLEIIPIIGIQVKLKLCYAAPA